ncbi:MAG: cation transporter [Acholeplasmatales bacterium]|nr:cation transporter [Acholeplasmatales bacterium]MBQ6783367.1 cation transporter [Acholeplasmatales bacterium]
MKKVFKIEVDCANCAAKVEKAISKIEGVKEVNINFMTQKMLFEAEDEKFDELLKLAIKTGKKVEPDFEVKM